VHKGTCKGHGRVQLAYGAFEGALKQRFELRWWGPCRRHRDLAVLAADHKPVALLRYRELLLPEPGAAGRTALVQAASVYGLAEFPICRVVNIEADCLGSRSKEVGLDRKIAIAKPVLIVAVAVLSLATHESRKKPRLGPRKGCVVLILLVVVGAALCSGTMRCSSRPYAVIPLVVIILLIVVPVLTSQIANTEVAVTAVKPSRCRHC